jgi:hypothetical protein
MAVSVLPQFPSQQIRIPNAVALVDSLIGGSFYTQSRRSAFIEVSMKAMIIKEIHHELFL